jgi:exodeoxyribonuclease-1
LRPDGIEWPLREDGSPSFKLEHLAQANRLEQARAHDATSDVIATVGLARLLRDRQPRLYEWCFGLRHKRAVIAKLAGALAARQPLLHVSHKYAARRGCLAMIVPLAEHPIREGTFIVADLDADPDAWTDLDSDDLMERMFTPRADLPQDMQRPPIKEVHANRSPFVAPIETLHNVDTRRIALDPDRCLDHLKKIRAVDGLGERIRHAFSARMPGRRDGEDPELMLYSGFASDADRKRFNEVRATPPERLGATEFSFGDPRYGELLFRYRARNWPNSLDADERERWRTFVCAKLTRESDARTLTLAQYFATIARLRTETPPGPLQALLDRLQAWGETVRVESGV